jgi:2-keto-4-pentenoate hydratase/2-oxohepta-3-ene-1,7-dioic acid hydratase in catechol pathway
MKLVSYRVNGLPSYGALKDGAIVDIAQRLSGAYPDLKSLLGAASENGLKTAADIVATTSADMRLDQVELLPVIPNPGTVWCAGMNTHSHFEEAKQYMHLTDEPAKPILFLRATSTLVGTGQSLEKPKLEPAFDFEGEIALVIGKRGRNIPTGEALTHVAGYSCFNDASARNYQRSSSQITAGKNTYRSGGFGPCLATPDEVDLRSMTMTCRLNGQAMQRMGLDDLIFSFAELISFISELTWLEPGDVIVTGSPAGIGALRSPMILLSAGDTVEVEVTGVGILVNGVTAQTL